MVASGHRVAVVLAGGACVDVHARARRVGGAHGPVAVRAVALVLDAPQVGALEACASTSLQGRSQFRLYV